MSGRDPWYSRSLLSRNCTMSSRILRINSRTVPPEVAKCCTKTYPYSCQPLTQLRGRNTSSQNGRVSILSFPTHPKLYSGPAPSPVGASASKALVSKVIAHIHQVTKMRVFGNETSSYPSDRFDRHFCSRAAVLNVVRGVGINARTFCKCSLPVEG